MTTFDPQTHTQRQESLVPGYQRPPLVLYHAGCPDGFCAAWVARKALGDGATYRPVSYGDDLPDAEGREVYILDFCPPAADLIRLCRGASSLVLLDHHQTAQAVVLQVGSVLSGVGARCKLKVTDGKAGCRMTWEHFFPGKKAPWLVDYVEDRDLWRWELPESEAVNAYIASKPFRFSEWDALENCTPGGCALLGEPIIRYRNRLVDRICANAHMHTLGNYHVPVVNTPILQSEAAGRLAEGQPFAGAWHKDSEGVERWSLRSREGGINVSEIAKAYGGGGHPRAAGFELRLK